MEIRHIPGKVNPTDAITRQVKTYDQVYFREVKQLDKDLVDAIRILVEASDARVQYRLNQLYNNEGTRDKKLQMQKQVLAEEDVQYSNAVLAMVESRIYLDDQFKRQFFNSLKKDD